MHEAKYFSRYTSARWLSLYVYVLGSFAIEDSAFLFAVSEHGIRKVLTGDLQN